MSIARTTEKSASRRRNLPITDDLQEPSSIPHASRIKGAKRPKKGRENRANNCCINLQIRQSSSKFQKPRLRSLFVLTNCPKQPLDMLGN